MKAHAAAAALMLLAAAPAAAQTIGDISARAQAGDGNAQYLLGEAYRTGQGVTPDRDIAISWFRKAAAQGNMKAADMMGLLLFSKGERRESIGLLQGAATRQDARALYLLGTAHFNGDGVPKDMPRAYAEMRAAANAGLPQAVRSLALMEPYITPQDRTAATMITPGTPSTLAVAPAAMQTAPRPSTPILGAVEQAPLPASPSQSGALASVSPVHSPAMVAPVAPPPAHDPAALVPVQHVALPPSTPPAPPPTPVPAPTPAAHTEAARPAPPPAPARPAGQWRIQLGALGSQAKAEEHWRTLVRKVPSLAGRPHVAVEAGPVWRLQMTGLDRAAAQSQCQEIKAKGGDCIVLAP